MSGAAPPDSESRRPSRSPFYEARHAPRYERQQLIRCYRDRHGCRPVVLIDRLFPDSVTLFEETLYDADPEQDLHVLLRLPAATARRPQTRSASPIPMPGTDRARPLIAARRGAP